MGDVLDGAVPDSSVSADAMRWSPRQAVSRWDGVDCSTGLAGRLDVLLRFSRVLQIKPGETGFGQLPVSR